MLIEDGGTLVLGGLIRDARPRGESACRSSAASRSSASVPHPQRKKNKTNLMVFIQPKILRDGVDAADRDHAKYNYMRDQQRALAGGKVPLLPGEQQPALPDARSSPPSPGGSSLAPPGTAPPAAAIGPRAACQAACGDGPSGADRHADGAGRPPGPQAAATRPRRLAHAAEDAILAAADRVADTRGLPFAFAKRHGVLVRGRRRRRRMRRAPGCRPRAWPRCAATCACR